MHKVFRSIVLSLAVGFLFCSVAVSESRAQAVLSEILRRMDEQNKSLSSLRAEFTRADVNAQLGDDPDITRGTVLYVPRPGKDALIRIDWRDPDRTLAIVDKKYVLYRPGLSQAYTGSVESAKENARTGNALAFMNMSRAQLKANYIVAYLGEATVAGGVKTLHLELTPKNAASFKSAEIWVDPNGFPVQSKINEKNGDSTTILLSRLEKNVTLDGSLFRVSLPKNTKIIKS